jgi:hypothetical protein
MTAQFRDNGLLNRLAGRNRIQVNRLALAVATQNMKNAIV